MAKAKAKKRVDQLLVERGLAPSRTRAQAFIMEGLVFSGERRIAKAGDTLPADATLEVRGKDHPWVSRGGIKLAHALEVFAIDPTDWCGLDIGSSTGGFTDVLLQKGARHVTAVDVGTNQLAWKLRNDPRVTVLEQTNARYLTREMVRGPVDIIVCDASFISMRKVLSTPLSFAAPGCWLVALVKPQFEAERQDVGKGGVVRDHEVHAAVVALCRQFVAELGWEVAGVATSPITGPKGNVEFLLGAVKKD